VHSKKGTTVPINCKMGFYYCKKQCYGSGMFIPDPGSRIPDPKTAMKDSGEKFFLSYLFFGAINFTKLNYFIFEMSKKNNLGQLSKNYRPFSQKIVTKLSKIWVWDPGSGKNLFRIQGSKGTGSRIRICNTGKKRTLYKFLSCSSYCKKQKRLSTLDTSL
jgi:hypothetical protein